MEQHPFFLYHEAYEDNRIPTLATITGAMACVSEMKLLMYTDTEIMTSNISFSITKVMGNATLFCNHLCNSHLIQMRYQYQYFLLLISELDSSSPDKFLVIPSYMPLFGVL